jgi:hypothetical protein
LLLLNPTPPLHGKSGFPQHGFHSIRSLDMARRQHQHGCGIGLHDVSVGRNQQFLFSSVRATREYQLFMLIEPKALTERFM